MVPAVYGFGPSILFSPAHLYTSAAQKQSELHLRTHGEKYIGSTIQGRTTEEKQTVRNMC